MQCSALQYKTSVASPESSFVAVHRLFRLADEWFADYQIRPHSPKTIELRRTLIGRFHWFVIDRDLSQCGKSELRQFFACLSAGHSSNQGLWGDDRYRKTLRPIHTASRCRGALNCNTL